MLDRSVQFEVFREAVAASFSFLGQFGLTPEGEKSSYRDIEMSFARPGLRIAVAYELGSGPWEYLEVGHEQVGLHLLVEDRDTSPSALEPLANLHLREQVAALAQLTQRYADDFLVGEYSRTPSLKRLRAKLTRERNQQVFGTATGESPRFEAKPTLPELFADADDSDLQAARAYQAFWDYGYSREQIAAFLNVAPANVEELLHSWESVS